MGIIKEIYKAPMTYSNEDNTVFAFLNYQGKEFVGVAKLHPNDKDFFSIKVGNNIARSRARISALKYEKIKAYREYKNKRNFLEQLMGYGAKKIEEVDPNFIIRNNIKRAEWRWAALIKAEKAEKKYLNDYLQSQEKALTSIRKYRQKANNN